MPMAKAFTVCDFETPCCSQVLLFLLNKLLVSEHFSSPCSQQYLYTASHSRCLARTKSQNVTIMASSSQNSAITAISRIAGAQTSGETNSRIRLDHVMRFSADQKGRMTHEITYFHMHTTQPTKLIFEICMKSVCKVVRSPWEVVQKQSTKT